MVVVFPCVPATTIDSRSPMKKRATAWGIDSIGTPRRTASSASGFPRDTAFPTTTRSASAGMFSAAYGEASRMPRLSSCVLIGG